MINSEAVTPKQVKHVSSFTPDNGPQHITAAEWHLCFFIIYNIPYSSKRRCANALNTHIMKIIKTTNSGEKKKNLGPYLFTHLMFMMDNDSSVVHSGLMRWRERVVIVSRGN